jgi:hypothetical protein
MLGWLLHGHESAKEWAPFEGARAVKADVNALRGLKVL